MKKILFFLCLGCSFISCKNGQLKTQLKNVIGHEIIIPNNMLGTYNGKDSVFNIIEKNVKMIVWYDSLVCSSCDISYMNEWNKVKFHSMGSNNMFELVFIFSPKKNRTAIQEIKNSLRIYPCDYPVFIDTSLMFSQLNSVILNDKRLHTFLLDKDNKVVLVGNPVNNESLWQLYKDEIKKLISD